MYYLGRVAFDRGEFSKSHEHWAESLSLCRARGFLWCVPYLLEGFACLAVAHHRPREGMRVAGAAEALHESIGAPLPPVWAADLDRRLEPARRALTDSALSAARSEGRTLPLDQACEAAASAAALAQPSSRRDTSQRAAHVLPHALTPREREVAVLVARGLTNRQIGEQLVITEGTARIHVEHILDKLSLGSRTQLARWVLDQKPPARD
jgi:DNA-binding CsgD family transcriptional regulator